MQLNPPFYNLRQSLNNLRCDEVFQSCGSVVSLIPGRGHFRNYNEYPDVS